MNWLIFYGDGRTFSSEDGEAHEAPRNNVQVVFRADDRVGIAYETSREGYWVWRNGRFEGVDDAMGLWDYRFHHPGWPLVIYGRTVPDFGELLGEASRLMGRLKTGRLEGEPA